MPPPPSAAPPPAPPADPIKSNHSRPAGLRRRDGIALAVCFLVSALLFSGVTTTLVIGVMTVAAYQVFYRRNRKIIALVTSVLLSLAGLSVFGNIIVRRYVAATNNIDVDHRNKPNAALGINAEGFRCTANASDFTAETYNILCFGDSFTYGLGMNPEDAFPQVLEKLIGESHPARQVRVVNCGWITCSPLLAKRALFEHGAKYKPSLVTYELDMTDFQDDLRYEYSDNRDTIDVSAVGFLAERIGLANPYAELRNRWALSRYWSKLRGQSVLVPYEKFFVATQPLESSRPYLKEIEI